MTPTAEVFEGVRGLLQVVRDLTLYDLADGMTLVVACDSAGAVGPKQLDAICASGYVLGRFTARVALMELLACGAQPILVVNALCVEPEPTGAEILRGVRDEAVLAGLDPDNAVTGSTEKSMPTLQTGLGVTAIGLCRRSQLRIARAVVGDALVCIGIPKLGNQVHLDDEQIVDLQTVRTLANVDWVHEIVPVGSAGAAAEAAELADACSLGVELFRCAGIDVTKSAGPCTCAVVACDAARWPELDRITSKPAALVGRVIKP